MNSFYGGRRGISFELVKTYDSKSAMTQDFASPLCSVAFGQYVSINSNDSDRGSIYRRTENLANGNSGAVLVGQITGQSGTNSQVSFIPYSQRSSSGIKYITIADDLISGKEVDDKIYYKEFIDYDEQHNLYKTSYGVQFPYNVIEFDTAFSYQNKFEIVENEKKPFYQNYTIKIPAVLSGNQIKQITLVTTDNFEDFDNIYLTPPKQGQITTFVSSFLAYALEEHSFIYSYVQVTPIGSPKENELFEIVEDNYVPTEDETDEGKDYYKRTTTENIETVWYKMCDFSQIDIEYDEFNRTITLTNKDSTQTTVPLNTIVKLEMDNNGIITATYIDGDSQIVNENTPIVWIKNIDSSQDGTNMIINYSDNTSQIIPCLINSVKEVSLNENGKLSVIYTQPIEIFSPVENVTSTSKPQQNHWYEINNKYYTYSSETTKEEYDAAIEAAKINYGSAIDFYIHTTDVLPVQYGEGLNKWYKTYFIISDFSINEKEVGTIRSIDSIIYDDENDNIIITYNTLGDNDQKETYSFKANLKGIKSINYEKSSGQIKVTYTDNSEQILDTPLAVSGISFNENYQLVFTFTDKTTMTTSKSISFPETLQFNDGTQRIEMVKNRHFEYIKIPNPIDDAINPKESNYYQFNSQTDEYYLTDDETPKSGTQYYQKVLKSNEVTPISPPLNYIKNVQINPKTYDLLILYSDPAKRQGGITYDGIQGWQILGNVKDNSGIFIDYVIKGSVFSNQYSTVEKSIEALNSEFSEGYKGRGSRSCIAIGPENGSKIIYGFDANNNTWYMLGKFGSESGVAANSEEAHAADPPTDYNVQALPPGGLWFVTENRMDDYDKGLELFGTHWENF